MSITYLCPACCKKFGIDFFGMAENRVGRKSCTECGGNQPPELHIISQPDLKKLAEKIRRINQ